MSNTFKRWIVRALDTFAAFTGVAFVALLLVAIWVPDSSGELAENLTLTSMVLCLAGGVSFMIGLFVNEQRDDE